MESYLKLLEYLKVWNNVHIQIEKLFCWSYNKTTITKVIFLSECQQLWFSGHTALRQDTNQQVHREISWGWRPSGLSKESTRTEMNGSRRSTKAKLEPLPDLSHDDLETVLDISGKSHYSNSMQTSPTGTITLGCHSHKQYFGIPSSLLQFIRQTLLSRVAY